jgi:hypothetical protein
VLFNALPRAHGIFFSPSKEIHARTNSFLELTCSLARFAQYPVCMDLGRVRRGSENRWILNGICGRQLIQPKAPQSAPRPPPVSPEPQLSKNQLQASPNQSLASPSWPKPPQVRPQSGPSLPKSDPSYQSQTQAFPSQPLAYPSQAQASPQSAPTQPPASRSESQASPSPLAMLAILQAPSHNALLAHPAKVRTNRMIA